MEQEDFIMSNIYNNIQYYLKMLKQSVIYKPQYFELINKEINNMYNFHLYYINQLKTRRYLDDLNLENNKEFTLKELSYYDGTKGKPAYVAVNGIIYDVSLNSTWGGGTHFNLYSGADLSKEFNSCHNLEVLTKLPKVGILINSVENRHEW